MGYMTLHQYEPSEMCDEECHPVKEFPRPHCSVCGETQEHTLKKAMNYAEPPKAKPAQA